MSANDAIARGLDAAEALATGRARIAIGMTQIAAVAGLPALRSVVETEMASVVERFAEDGQAA